MATIAPRLRTRFWVRHNHANRKLRTANSAPLSQMPRLAHRSGATVRGAFSALSRLWGFLMRRRSRRLQAAGSASRTTSVQAAAAAGEQRALPVGAGASSVAGAYGANSVPAALQTNRARRTEACDGDQSPVGEHAAAATAFVSTHRQEINAADEEMVDAAAADASSFEEDEGSDMELDHYVMNSSAVDLRVAHMAREVRETRGFAAVALSSMRLLLFFHLLLLLCSENVCLPSHEPQAADEMKVRERWQAVGAHLELDCVRGLVSISLRLPSSQEEDECTPTPQAVALAQLGFEHSLLRSPEPSPCQTRAAIPPISSVRRRVRPSFNSDTTTSLLSLQCMLALQRIHGWGTLQPWHPLPARFSGGADTFSRGNLLVRGSAFILFLQVVVSIDVAGSAAPSLRDVFHRFPKGQVRRAFFQPEANGM